MKFSMNDKNWRYLFAQTLDAFIEKSDFSLKKLSENSGLSRTSVRRYCSGEYLPQKLDTVTNLADALGLPEEETKELHYHYFVSRYGLKMYEIFRFFDQYPEGGNLDMAWKVEIPGAMPIQTTPFDGIDIADWNTFLGRLRYILKEGAPNQKISIVLNIEEENMPFINPIFQILSESPWEVEHFFSLPEMACIDDLGDLCTLKNVLQNSDRIQNYRTYYCGASKSNSEEHGLIIGDDWLVEFYYSKPAMDRPICKEHEFIKGLFINDPAVVQYYKKDFEKRRSRYYPYSSIGNQGEAGNKPIISEYRGEDREYLSIPIAQNRWVNICENNLNYIWNRYNSDAMQYYNHYF